MLIKRIELENIKSYRQLTIDFRRGTTAISGANGAGKTTIVEAIGFALFDSLPYSQSQFVREGEKFGRVVVQLLGNDDRIYEVERRCGSGARWVVYDTEADYRVEQRTDVLDKLHELFGIDRERPLDKLFQDALGVPQGTFTAIFLQTPAVRKQTFDALLQIEDYKTAFDYLLDAQKQYKDQMQIQQNEIQRLNFEVRELESWRITLKDARRQDELQKEQNVQWTQQLTHYEGRLGLLIQQRDQLKDLNAQFEQSQVQHKLAHQRLHDRQLELERARIARQAVEANLADYQRYQQVDITLKRLRTEEKKRNLLLQEQAQVQNQLSIINANLDKWNGRLTEVATARLRLVDLVPLFEQQVELEKQRESLNQQAIEYDRLVKEGKRLVKLRDDYLEKQKELEQRIAEIEPLQASAAMLNTHIETVSRLTMQSKERSVKRQQLEEKRRLLQEKNEEREATTANIRKAETQIAKIEEHRQEAEELPTLQAQYEQLLAQRHRLDGNIEAYLDSRSKSVGGQCPLLHEPCLNIKQRGMLSLESYFDGLIVDERAQLVEVQQSQGIVADRITVVKKFADALDKLGQYTELHNGNIERLQRISMDITRLEREVETLVQDLEELKQIDQLISRAEAARKESQNADQQVRELNSLRVQVQQLHQQAEDCDKEIIELRKQVEELSTGRKLLAQVNQQLAALDDPRAHTKAQQEIIKQEPVYQRQLQEEQQKQQATTQQMLQVEQQLLVYSDLDMHINEQEMLRKESQGGYEVYLQNEREAALLPEREHTYKQAYTVAEQADLALQLAEQAYLQARAVYSEEELEEVGRVIEDLRDKRSRLAGEMSTLQQKINGLVQSIQQAEALLIDLEAAQKESGTLDELQKMMEQFRKLIREAAPHVLKALLNDISAEANRIFGEIMGDRSAQLSWQNDYEIVLRRQGVNRHFSQLSGGEQMSAALSVRLALLKKLSNLNIAFFDEPTQNMDEMRRMNLAEQIRRVRGFDQLLVISHDDTFEQSLDTMVRLQKINGETRLLSEDDVVRIREREQMHAS